MMKNILNLIIIYSFLIKFIKLSLFQIDENYEKIVIENIKSLKSQNLQFFESEKVKNPLISIVIPVKNGADLITYCLRSVQYQSLKDIEIIVIDDGSTDNTYEILQQIKKYDKRVKVFKHKKNRGTLFTRLYYALNSEAKYVTFLDHDDLYYNMQYLKNLYEQTQIFKNVDLIHTVYSLSEYDGKDNYNKLFGLALNTDNFNTLLKKPNIADILYNPKERYDYTSISVVYNKLYSKTLIKKIAESLGEDFWYSNLSQSEDFLMNIAAFINAETYVAIKNIGLWHWNSNPKGLFAGIYGYKNKKLINPIIQNKKLNDVISIFTKMFDLMENDKRSINTRKFILFSLGDEEIKTFARSDHYEKLLILVKKFYHSKFIEQKDKEEIKSYFQKVASFNLSIKDKYPEMFNIKKEKKHKNSNYSLDDL